MPVLIACPHPKCNHPGPLGFSDGGPWGSRFYHTDCRHGQCPGMWLYNDQWYETEAEAWEQYKKDCGPFDPDWTAAFDARILRRDLKAYEKHINRWSERALAAR